jgi:CRP-like cAMP-binding protein
MAMMSRSLADRVFEYHTYDVRGRIISEILRLLAADHHVDVVRFTAKDMAGRVGTTLENVSKILSGLVDEALLHRATGGFGVTDIEALKRRQADCVFG